MSYDGFYGGLSTRGTVNDLLEQANNIKVSIEASEAAVAEDTSDLDLKHAEVVLKATQVQTNADLVSTKAQEVSLKAAQVQANADLVSTKAQEVSLKATQVQTNADLVSTKAQEVSLKATQVQANADLVSTKAQEVQDNSDYVAGIVAGGSLVVIDDAAGLGDTNVTWSADKSSRELEDKVDKVTGKELSDTNFTQVEKTKLAGIATAATKNRVDTLNADKAHTHTTAQVTGLDTALSGKADKTTQVIAGTGLAGGGTLASNLTLNVSYGTTAGTSVQGNDSRVVNALQKANILQTTGTSTTVLMSQKATTDAIANIPSVPKTAAYTATALDKGKSIDTTANVTIPVSVFAVGDVIVVTNTSASDISITPASGVTFRLAGSDSTGVRTLAGYGVATLRMVSSNVWFASGAGLS